MERHPRPSPIPVDNMGLSNFLVTSHGNRKPYVDHLSEQVYSLTRVSTLIAVILNILGFDSSVPINCQVRIIFPGFPYARADPNYLGQGLDYL